MGKVTDMTAVTEQNKFYCVEFHNNLMGSIIPVIPMWTSVMRSKILDTTERASNAPAESWFGDLKNNKKCKRLKCGRFVKLTREIILSRSKEVLMDIPSNYCAKSRTQNKIITKKKESTGIERMFELISSDEEEEMEHWQPRKKQKGFYFKGHLKAASKRLNAEVKVNDSPSTVPLEVNDSVTPNSKTITEPCEPVESIGNCVTPDMRMTLNESLKSYESPIDGSLPKIPLYENRLVKDISYYGQVFQTNKKQLNYLIGTYSFIEDITGLLELRFEDYNVLSDLRTSNTDIVKKNTTKKMWLNNFVIDIAMGVLRKICGESKDPIQIVCCNISLYVYNNGIRKDNYKIDTITVLKNSLLIMPLNITGNHWTIAFADFHNCNFYYMDPVGGFHNKANYVYTILSKELERKHVYSEFGTKWPKLKVQNLAYPRQQDSYNCGVYCLYYAECMMRNSKNVIFDTNFDPMVYRIKLKKILLENSDFVRDICLYCGNLDAQHKKIEQNNFNWIQCGICTRWIIMDCVAKFEKKLDYSGNFECLLCKAYFEK